MRSFTITYWTGETNTVEAESVQSAFTTTYGKITKTGYTRSEVWLDGNSVYNSNGDFVARIAECAPLTGQA